MTHTSGATARTGGGTEVTCLLSTAMFSTLTESEAIYPSFDAATLRPIMEKDALAVFLDSPSHSRIGNMDRMILILLFDTAIRFSELTAVTLGDILLDVESPVVLFMEKAGNNARLLFQSRPGNI